MRHCPARHRVAGWPAPRARTNPQQSGAAESGIAASAAHARRTTRQRDSRRIIAHLPYWPRELQLAHARVVEKEGAPGETACVRWSRNARDQEPQRQAVTANAAGLQSFYHQFYVRVPVIFEKIWTRARKYWWAVAASAASDRCQSRHRRGCCFARSDRAHWPTPLARDPVVSPRVAPSGVPPGAGLLRCEIPHMVTSGGRVRRAGPTPRA